MNRSTLLAAARGDQLADHLLHNGQIINVFSGTIERADVALAGGRIVGIGPGYRAQTVVDLGGAFIVPGLIDAHVHIESSLCTPPQFARAIVPHGITTIVTDPHEIANVAGVPGIRYMAAASRGLPLGVFLMAPSCVPATHMETSGATLTAADLLPLLQDGTVHGLAELMNFPGVINGDEAMLAKIAAFAGHPRDGHAPALRNQALNAYVAAGIGSEHECTTVDEAAEKLARGLYILIREATNAHNLHNLLPLVTPHNSRRICFCTDDRIPSDLLDQGTIDYMVREAIAFGLDPITAIRMATLNPVEWFGLRDRGAIAPGRVADLLIVDNLYDFRPRQVYVAGQLVAEAGSVIEAQWSSRATTPATIPSSVNIDWNQVDFQIPARGQRIRVIGSLDNQLVTEARILDATIVDGQAVADPTRDLLKMAVIERHHGSGALGLGFIQGIGLQRGAIAGTVAHDHHNLVVIGADDAAMMMAARAVGEMGGGLAIVDGMQLVAQLPLPVAGLMSDQPVAAVRQAYDALIAAAHAQGSELHDPFMAMSFMALEVIPSLKLTDQGLVDVEQFAVVDLFV
jgi:adenine deaminase